ncbi:hypothetical protein C484_00820 [Natrialba taiwanensis DSM 12281]|uniref:Uncharacterized protein n=2 Tax=Natrialba taiwanensis TaxID=160846 RepID=M0AGN4_9EURY|nr:hypothetical protein C484_00820 [Natrialba taiwanensis DSM 12281]
MFSMTEQLEDKTEHEFVFYLYEEDEEDPRFSFWLETSDGSGMSLYERLPDGQGMWLKPSEGSDHGAVEPTDELKAVISELMANDVSADRVHDLAPHERHFVQGIHGTVDQNPDAIPNPVWGWMHDAAEEVEA